MMNDWLSAFPDKLSQVCHQIQYVPIPSRCIRVWQLPPSWERRFKHSNLDLVIDASHIDMAIDNIFNVSYGFQNKQTQLLITPLS